MIKHIVMWKLEDFAEGSSKEENARKIKELLEGLKDKIEEIRHIEVGINFEASEFAYDVALYSEFDSVEKLNIYQKHPEHLKVAQFVGKVKAKRVVVDYSI